MTMQFDDLAAQRSHDGWTLARVPEGGNFQIHLLDDWGACLLSIDLASALPGFSRFAHWTTAGMAWSEQMLAYFTANQRHLVVRAWWGARLVIALDQLRPIDPSGLFNELGATESELVMQELRQLAARVEGGERPQHDGPSGVTHCTADTLAHFPGLLGLANAIPLLRVLEERADASGECFDSFHYHPHSTRRLAQISLRRLGEKPQGYPAMTFAEAEKRVPLRQPQPGPIDGPTRHANLARVRKHVPIAEVYQLLGAPDEIGRGVADDSWRRHHFWRYDVDVDPPYTMLLWLGDGDAVERIVRYDPPFWTGPDIFPSPAHSLLGSDGTTVCAYIGELDDDTFAGTRIEVIG